MDSHLYCSVVLVCTYILCRYSSTAVPETPLELQLGCAAANNRVARRGGLKGDLVAALAARTTGPLSEVVSRQVVWC